jgi:hypothetical protein
MKAYQAFSILLTLNQAGIVSQKQILEFAQDNESGGNGTAVFTPEMLNILKKFGQGKYDQKLQEFRR